MGEYIVGILAAIGMVSILLRVVLFFKPNKPVSGWDLRDYDPTKRRHIIIENDFLKNYWTDPTEPERKAKSEQD